MHLLTLGHLRHVGALGAACLLPLALATACNSPGRNPPIETTGTSIPNNSGGASVAATTDAGLGDAGCAPDLVGFVASYHAPQAHQAGCTAAQAQTYYNDCLGPTATSSLCEEWPTMTANAACNTCLLGASSPAGTTWGPILVYPETVTFDEGACIALDVPADTACATAVEEAEECVHAACDNACVGSTAGEPSCLAEAQTVTCLSYEQGAATACGSVSSVCFTASSEEASFLAIAGVFCE